MTEGSSNLHDNNAGSPRGRVSTGRPASDVPERGESKVKCRCRAFYLVRQEAASNEVPQ